MIEPENTTAQRVLDTVEAHPGIHFRGLLRRAGLASAGQLRHHLDKLHRSQRVVEVTDGGFTRYFAGGTYDRRLREQMLRLARPIPRRVARLLLQGPMPRTQIRRSLGCAESTLGYYLARMHDEGLVVKERQANRQLYALAEPDMVRQVLEAQATHAQALREDGVTPPPASGPWSVATA